MKKIVLSILVLAFILFSCNNGDSLNNYQVPENIEDNSSETSSDPNASPSIVMSTIFDAAKTGEVGVLRFLLPPNDECDGDCKALCNPGNERMREELGHNYIDLENFMLGFSKGKVVGEPLISGDEASVNFIFGPNLEANETMQMQKINGKWYLQSF